MRTFKCRGTLGDSYIVNCVVHYLAKREEILIKQCSDYSGNAVDDWKPHIRQIYSLLPNIHVDFVDKEEFDRLSVPRLCPSVEKANEVRVCKVTPHPPFVYPETTQVPWTNYIACSPRGGKSDERHRQMGEEETITIFEQYPNHKFVLVGDNPEFLDYRRDNVTNLIGNTSLLEAMGIVARAKGFIGVQGLMAYVAAGSKVPSVVYTKSLGYGKAFRARLFPEWEAYCTIYKTHRAEDTPAFVRFMSEQSHT